MTATATATAARRQPLNVLLRRSDHKATDEPDFDFSSPIDRSRLFVCPTLTPLYYTKIYQDLNDEQRRRYNQLTAMSFNELIAFFENTFAMSVLVALADARHHRVDEEMAECLASFIADERKHIGWWQQLNRLSDPAMYATSEQHLIRFSSFARSLLGRLTAHPHSFPVVFWIMLALEERSLDISHRTLQLLDEIEPRYRLIYRQHLTDEARHVQFDWHLIERFYATRSRPVRWYNAKLFGQMVGRFFLPPTRSAVRVIRCLVSEYPELEPLVSEMTRQLKQLGNDQEYHEMMYSRQTTPITFQLLDQFEEMHGLRRVLRSYIPNMEGVTRGADG